MMEVEMSDGNIRQWMDVRYSDDIRFLFEVGYDLTGNWRINGPGKNYDIVHPEL